MAGLVFHAVDALWKQTDTEAYGVKTFGGARPVIALTRELTQFDHCDPMNDIRTRTHAHVAGIGTAWRE
jgi:hypothetical protein